MAVWKCEIETPVGLGNHKEVTPLSLGKCDE